MHVDVICRSSASAARLRLDRGETVTCELGSMIAMSPGLEVDTTTRNRGGGGILKGLKRMFSGENFFLNHYTAQADGQELILAPALVGDVSQHRLSGGGRIIIQGSCWLAAGDGIDIDTTWQGLVKGIFGGEGLFWVKCSGEGEVLFHSFGGIYTVDIIDRYTVDTGHIVAFEDTLDFRIGKASRSLIGSFLGGEGLVCKFQGQGRLWCQTHNPPGFGGTLGPLLKPIRR